MNITNGTPRTVYHNGVVFKFISQLITVPIFQLAEEMVSG